LGLRVCNVCKVFQVEKHFQVLDWFCVSIDFMMLSGFKASGRTANSQILCKVKGFRMG
jgi:hypothetical protein